MTKHEELFKKYEGLATKFASKVFNHSYIGFEKDDIVQEFRIKLYETILAYERSVERRQQRGMIRPVPLPYYISGALNNFVKDYIKKIKESQNIFVENSSTFEYEYAQYSSDIIEIDTDKNIYNFNGFDLLEPLSGLKRACFVMWLKGTPTAQLDKTFGKNFNVFNLIHKHKQYLKSKRELFDIENISEIFSTRSLELV